MVVCSAVARVAQVIREALARGADRAIHVEDRRSRADASAWRPRWRVMGEEQPISFSPPQSDDRGWRRPASSSWSARTARDIIMEVDLERRGRKPATFASSASRGRFPVGCHAAAGAADDQSGINQLRTRR